MADDVTIDNGELTNFTTATDDVGGRHYQYVKLADGTDGGSGKIGGDATNGLDVDVTRLPALTAGTAYVGKVRLTDGTTDATVRELGTNDALNVAIVDGSGNQLTTFGTGGTSATDDADFTAATTNGTPIMGVREDSPTTVTDGDMGVIGIDSNRRVKVSVDASALDIAHDAVDGSSAPVKVGMQARTSWPTAVANADRVNAIADTTGRQLTSHIPPALFVWKQVEATTTQTGTTIWDPTAGTRIAVTGYEIGTGGTTQALVTLWFGDNADVTFTQGTDQVLFRGTLTPTSTSTPGVISNLTHPVFCTTADRELHYTTSAGITIYITVYGYEW